MRLPTAIFDAVIRDIESRPKAQRPKNTDEFVKELRAELALRGWVQADVADIESWAMVAAPQQAYGKQTA